ncbi:hypothetical protein JCM10207_007761 [Rhodosporidiobolus poonsookiae]
MPHASRDPGFAQPRSRPQSRSRSPRPAALVAARAFPLPVVQLSGPPPTATSGLESVFPLVGSLASLVSPVARLQHRLRAQQPRAALGPEGGWGLVGAAAIAADVLAELAEKLHHRGSGSTSASLLPASLSTPIFGTVWDLTELWPNVLLPKLAGSILNDAQSTSCYAAIEAWQRMGDYHPPRYDLYKLATPETQHQWRRETISVEAPRIQTYETADGPVHHADLFHDLKLRSVHGHSWLFAVASPTTNLAFCMVDYLRCHHRQEVNQARAAFLGLVLVERYRRHLSLHSHAPGHGQPGWEQDAAVVAIQDAVGCLWTGKEYRQLTASGILTAAVARTTISQLAEWFCDQTKEPLPQVESEFHAVAECLRNLLSLPDFKPAPSRRGPARSGSTERRALGHSVNALGKTSAPSISPFWPATRRF